ncbi:tRNA (N6-threonylcarbamoyladenosine(37)-N6)-methyltransferase TrmO [Cellvibrio mixtus]|uniref:tRNA (N6-threonylcarbamoyladenosine(37)-N6)-methyltransferase TrmO n=1 Tax=Cellvibrio mixtus TaxID=39650 RepID=UPI00058788D5|nr:tRNA (N6-threonylcarbamoyladenosine(37)-N6)-methyltransferase TrmO [Cellvibrio mixtus]
MNFTFPAIGIVHSCFKEKFGIPRQPGLAPLAEAEIEMLPPFDDINAFEGLINGFDGQQGATHLWVQFVFHANKREAWKAKVKPPRLGGNKTLGVFATRSPTRPAPIGLSVVRLRGIIERDGKVFVHISGVDLLEGTPVLDIKPYVPYVDCVLAAENSFAPAPPEPVAVNIPAELMAQCIAYWKKTGTDLAGLITQVLQQDPRPQYQQPEPERVYGMKLLDLDVRWQYRCENDAYSIYLTQLLFQPD